MTQPDPTPQAEDIEPPSAPAVLAAAAAYQQRFVADNLSAAPTRHLVVVTCMDARLDLFRLLGLEIGDAHILRNAGGRVTDDVLRSLTLSNHWLGTREVVVIHHTGCGLFGVHNDEIHARVHDATGADASSIDFDHVYAAWKVSPPLKRLRSVT